MTQKTPEFKARLQEGETLDDLLPEAFAAVREASKRTLGLRHYDIQLIGGMTLHAGKIAEMRTGEGKTLVATSRSTLTLSQGGVCIWLQLMITLPGAMHAGWHPFTTYWVESGGVANGCPH